MIIIIGSLLLINNLGIISFRDWGERVISNTPFVQEYVRTSEEYDKVIQENEELKLQVITKESRVKELEEKLEEVEKENQKLSNQIDEIQNSDEQNKENFDKLLKIYENMNPKSAADILNSLEKELALKILRGLDDKTAASILETMEIDKAVEFSNEMQ